MNNKKRWMILIVMVLAFIGLSSLAFAQTYPPPPLPPTMEEQAPPPAPAPTEHWVPGHWEWNGHEYKWSAGQWVEPPYTNAVWVPGHWDWNGSDWVWVPGHWQQ